MFSKMNTTVKPVSKVELFKKLSGFNTDTHSSRIVCTDEFVGDYIGLQLGNGGGWCRLDGDFGKKNKICVVKRSGEFRFSWRPSDEEDLLLRQEVTAFVEQNTSSIVFGKGNTVYLLKICGALNDLSARPIRQDIRNALKAGPCVVCGTCSQIEIDHKNGMYNDPRVLCIQTQTVEDFQPLCKHCNDQKRETYNYMKREGKRYPATNIPAWKAFGVDYTSGNETYDPMDINATVGTFWHDPVVFAAFVYKK
jgi:hypothetical protein